MSDSLRDIPGKHGNLWLHRFAVLTVLATFPLIFIGGLVTSHEAALAVPDWPTSYGYNMFLFPWQKMVGGIFYEHIHRQVASVVGFMTIILVVWLKVQEPRQWVRRLGLLALALVVFQGLLGGLRVLLVIQPIAIFHACLAQTFFCLIVSIALFTSPWWKARDQVFPLRQDKTLRKITVWTSVFIFIQLALGAVMRHTNSGLAAPDFPWIYGKIIPPLNSVALEQVNQQRIWQWNLEPVSLSQIMIHLGHRMGAVIVLMAVLSVVWIVCRRHWNCKELRLLALILMVLTLLQCMLGISVIWTKKAADIATAHVAVGALTLAASFILSLISFKLVAPIPDLASISLTTAEGIVA